LERSDSEEGEELSDEDEELLEKCIEIMRQERKASTSLFQRRLRLGYTRAARVLDILEVRGYVGPGEGAKPRDILVDLDAM
jgi:S-DNA-T family DNA segregation ATPase FtsK/SpoIIIE